MEKAGAEGKPELELVLGVGLEWFPHSKRSSRKDKGDTNGFSTTRAHQVPRSPSGGLTHTERRTRTVTAKYTHSTLQAQRPMRSGPSCENYTVVVMFSLSLYDVH